MEEENFNIDLELLKTEAEEVIKSLPNPFGSFEKAKYSLYCTSSIIPYRVPLYSFVTTSHNTEECIEILKEKFNSIAIYVRPRKYFTIFKTLHGEKPKVIYTNTFYK